MLLVNGNGRKI